MHDTPDKRLLVVVEGRTRDAGGAQVHAWLRLLPGMACDEAWVSGLVEALNQALGKVEGPEGLVALPLIHGHPCVGRWVGGCPLGLEGSQPPLAWNFQERLAHAMAAPHRAPLAMGRVGLGAGMEKAARPLGAAFQAAVREALVRQMGPAAVAEVVLEPESSLEERLGGGLSL